MILGWSEIAPRLALFTVVIWLPFVVTVGIFHGHLGRDRVSPPEGILLVLFAVGAAYGMQWMYHGLRREEAALVPDIALRFVNPRRPMLEIVNRSDTIVRDIKWTPVLWDIDHPGPTPLEPLEIPVQSFDWLRPDQYGGPEVIFDRPTVLSQIKPGDRVYGSCPSSAQGAPVGARTFSRFAGIKAVGTTKCHTMQKMHYQRRTPRKHCCNLRPLSMQSRECPSEYR